MVLGTLSLAQLYSLMCFFLLKKLSFKRPVQKLDIDKLDHNQ